MQRVWQPLKDCFSADAQHAGKHREGTLGIHVVLSRTVVGKDASSSVLGLRRDPPLPCYGTASGTKQSTPGTRFEQAATGNSCRQEAKRLGSSARTDALLLLRIFGMQTVCGLNFAHGKAQCQHFQVVCGGATAG